ncbi:MAG: hypothetical protein LC791_06055 [Acidobacteria bacterium]|nr:hypothetical protein [Acidobacteriota bacterium]
MPPEANRDELSRRVDAIEGGYEFMLAYAAQGVATDVGAASGEKIREYLRRFDLALTGLADLYRGLASREGKGSPEALTAFLDVLARDAAASQAAIQLVLAQPGISSQLVDNLNASIHVRALLTDIFLIDELLKK